MSEIGLIGKKIGMTRQFFKTGQSVPVTVLKVEKARVIQLINKDKRGYNFISKNKVEVLSINFDELNIISINHSYKLAENTIFIQQPLVKFHKEKITKPIGWIFRRNLDYVSLDYVDGDWNRNFLWSCEKVTSGQLEKRLKNTIDKLIKAIESNLKEHNYE